MDSRFKKIRKWVWSIIGMAIATALASVIKVFCEKDVFAYFTFAYLQIVKILCYEIKIWVFILVAVSVFLAVFIVWRVTRNKTYDYQTDTINSIKWLWEWKRGKMPKIENLSSLCPKDDTRMMRVYQGFDCPRCKYRYSIAEKDLVGVEAVIFDNLRKKGINMPCHKQRCDKDAI